jgi:predicted PurR-regulated permease PerM
MFNWWKEMSPSRRKKLVLLVVTALVVLGILWVARGVLAPYLAGLMIAYLLAPMIDALEGGMNRLAEYDRWHFLRRVSRPIAVGVTYVVVIAALVGFFAIGVPMVVEQGKALWEERRIVGQYASDFFEDLIEQYQLLDPRIQAQIEQALGDFSARLTNIIQQALEGTAVAISYTVSLVLAIVVIPFWMFYLLRDLPEIAKHVRTSIPEQLRSDVFAIYRLVDDAMSSYLRGRLFLGFVIGVVSAFVFSLMGVRFALFLGLIAGIFEMIPSIGPTLGAIPAILVALAQSPTLALWTTLFAFAVQQVENIFLTPKVLGDSVKLHSVVIMVVLIIGSEIAGLVGLFLGPVVTAVLRDIFRYFYFRFQDPPRTPEEAFDAVREGGVLQIRF